MMPGVSDVDVDGALKRLDLVSDTVILTIIIILLFRESASFSSRELAPYYSLLLLTALMHLMGTFIEGSLCLWNLSHGAQKHVRFVIVP